MLFRSPANGIRKLKIDWGPLEDDGAGDADPQVARRVVEFLGRQHDRPFFLGCGFVGTHIPWYAPQRYFNRFRPEDVKLPPYLAGDLNDVPKSAIRPQALQHHRQIVAAGAWQRAVAAYLACIHYVDDSLGRVLAALAAGPYRDNTVVVLWADHGWHLGEKDHWQKFTLWERSCRVPDRKSTRLNSSHIQKSRMPSSA